MSQGISGYKEEKSKMDRVWTNLPYDLVRVIIQMAGLNHSCMGYIKFEPKKLDRIPYIDFPSFNLLQKFTDNLRIVIISGKNRFTMNIFDNTHNRFQQPDKSVVYTYEDAITTSREMLYSLDDDDYVEFTTQSNVDGEWWIV